MTRRDFIKRTTLNGVVAAGAATGLPILSRATPSPSSASETLVTSLHKSLTDDQRRVLCFPFQHSLRSKVDNNWQITEPSIGELLNKDQQAMVREIFRHLHNPEYADRIIHQVEHDAGKDGFGACSIALFGEPGTGKFEFVLTGRHVTRRCDGDSLEGTAFGGPIFYGHAAESDNEKPDHPGNVYWYQSVRANEVFQALDGKQRDLALLGTARPEEGNKTVRLTGKSEGLPGLPLTELSRDQKELLRKVMADLLAPFRKDDADEALQLIEKNGFDRLHLAYYKNQDIGNDGVWDVWQIEGPTMLWYFRGKPHVHVWVNVKETA